LKEIRDHSNESFKLQQEISRQVMETFKYSANYNLNRIQEIDRRLENTMDALSKADIKVDSVKQKTSELERKSDTFNEGFIKFETSMKEKKLNESLQHIETQIINLQSRLADTLGSLEKERSKAEKLVNQLPGINLNPDVFKNPSGVCIVKNRVNLRVNAGTENESLGMLNKGTRVDKLDKVNGDWVYVRHLTRIGYAWAQSLNCNK
jgi:prefoldin subunit 5